ncbi:zinc metalloproteinase nas-39-like [Diadema setosum]|uniref:zinc metalloproteinase nas-39-like n=1 Tax=Diadema setosum TaxID=31175 RepID=UPI003B3B5B03
MCSECRELRSNLPGFTGYSGVGPPCVNFPLQNSVSCPQSGSCKFMNITSYLYHPMFGNVTMTQLERGCSDEGMPPNVCLTLADVPGVMEGLRGSLEASGMTFQGLEGQICTCNTGDLCNEGPSGVVATTSAATSDAGTTEQPLVPDTNGGYINLVPELTYRIASPNFPNNYPNSNRVLWSISAPDGCSLNVRFLNFRTESSYDYVKAGPGLTEADVATESRRHSGDRETPFDIMVNSNEAFVYFYSDGSLSYSGFRADLTLQCQEGAGTTVVPNEEGGSFTLTEGDEMVIASTNFPESYINLALRTWRFRVDAGCTVEIGFQEFETESHFDTVNIGRGSSEVAEETLSGSRDGEIFRVNDESAWVKFTSDSSVTMGGFKAFVRPVCIP